MGTFTYPHFFPVVVGVAPDKIKTLHPLDMRALCEAFKELTGIDPLQDGVTAHKVFQNGAWRRQGRLALSDASGNKARGVNISNEP